MSNVKKTLDSLIEDANYADIRKRLDNSGKRIITIAQYCKERGMRSIEIGSMLIDVCNNKECTNCRRISDSIKEQVLSLKIKK